MKVVLKNVVLRFADIFEPKEFERGDGKPRYNASFLVEPGSENDKAVMAAIHEGLKDKFKDKADAKFKTFWGQKQQCCYRDGNTLDYAGCEDMMFLSSSRGADAVAKKGKPAIVDRAKEPLGKDSGKPFPGCTVNAIVDIWIQTEGYPGIRADLRTVQYVADGEPFGNDGNDIDELPDLAEDILDDDLV